MKNTTNVFLDGIITDQNPLTMPQTALTSALNATIITGNGNEGLLLNDMGNTLIKDSITGNIMSLSNGFIPLGMKERGGILYIASYNPQTKEGELGTIPSPIIAYTYNENSNTETTNLTISDIKSSDTSDDILVDDRLYKSQIYILSDHVFHGGDKFIVILNLNLEKNTAELYATTYKQIISNSELNPYISEINFPQITNIKNRGWFKIKLLALGINGEDPKELVSITNEAQEYYTTSGKKTSDYWFINSNEIEGVFNLNKTRTSNLFRTFPNIQSGRLAIQFEVEKPEQLEYLYNKQYGKNLPLLIALETETGADYYAAVHGFLYNNGLCAIQPDKIVVTCNYPIYLSKNNNGVYNIDTSEQFTKIEIYSKPNPDDLGDINNNSGRIKTDFSGKPAACGFAYLSNILNLNKITNKFIISKYRDSSNIEFENYSNNNDALFFIKLESFDKDIEVSVDLYTKDFVTNKDSYVKYDSYKLPAFNPLEEEGQNDIDRKTTVQALFINKPLNVKYDFELFNNVDFDNGELACFICENGEDENSYILEYDSRTRKYVETQHKLKDYVSLKTWIYPITVFKENATDVSTELLSNHGARSAGDAPYHFLWDLCCHYLFRHYLTENGMDGLPTYKLPELPSLANSSGEKKTILLPLYLPALTTDEAKISMYLKANEAKLRASKYTNLNLTVDGFKNYCLLDNNLSCFVNYIYGQDIVNGLFLAHWNNDGGQTRSAQFYEETFLNDTGELHIFNGLSLSDITEKLNLPRDWTNLQKVGQGADNICNNTRYSMLLGWWWDYLNSLFYGGYRPYILGSTHVEHDLNQTTAFLSISGLNTLNLKNDDLFLSSLGFNNNIPHNCVIGQQASFITFLAKSTPGYIPCNTKHNLLNIHVCNYTNNFPLEYLYKNALTATFINRGDSTITLNYLNSGLDGTLNYQSWLTALTNEYLVIMTTDIGFIKEYLTQSPIPLVNNFTTKTITDGNESDSKNYSLETLESFIDYSNKGISALGIGTSSVEVKIDNTAKNVYVQTECNIKVEDGFADNLYYKRYDDAEDLILSPDDIVNLGDNTTTVKSLRKTIIKHIESNNILTTSRAKLFVDKSLSNLSYTNKSDYSIDYILSLKNNYGIKILNGSIPTQTVSNIDTTNLLANSDIGEVETMNDLKILEGLGTIENSLDICNNSFLNENGYLTQLDQTLIFNPVSVSKGWYVFNINYNYGSDFETVLYINGSACGSIKDSENLHMHMIAIYIPSPNNITISLSGFGGNSYYIKNCGLYKVNDGIIQEEYENITGVTNDNILSKIVLPGVFCFKEQLFNGNKIEKIGCIDQEYKGFQALPDRSYQLVVGIYYLNNDMTTAYFDNKTLPAELKCNSDALLNYITNNIFKNNGLQIRHSV